MEDKQELDEETEQEESEESKQETRDWRKEEDEESEGPQEYEEIEESEPLEEIIEEIPTAYPRFSSGQAVAPSLEAVEPIQQGAQPLEAELGDVAGTSTEETQHEQESRLYNPQNFEPTTETGSEEETYPEMIAQPTQEFSNRTAREAAFFPSQQMEFTGSNIIQPRARMPSEQEWHHTELEKIDDKKYETGRLKPTKRDRRRL